MIHGMIHDRELLAFRRSYYEMLVALFWREPTEELLRQLANGITERIQATRELHPVLAAGWEETDRFLARTSSESLSEVIADEYTRLFIGPHGPAVNPYESFYLTGRLLDRPLANVRMFLKTVGLEKQEGYAEPEDALAFELEVMRWLIGKQAAAANPQEEESWLRLQADFLGGHLLVWAAACAQDIERAGDAKFYRAAAKLLRGFLEIELSFFREWGLNKVTSLDEARQRYGAFQAWKGPTFDPTGAKPGTPSSDREG